MHALVIGAPDGLAGAVARRLRRRGDHVLQAIAADAADADRAGWLLEEAGEPQLIVVLECAPYRTLDVLLERTRAQIVLVAEQRTAAVGARPAPARGWMPRDMEGLATLALGRAGRRWYALGRGRAEPMGAERAAALVLSACDVAAASCR